MHNEGGKVVPLPAAELPGLGVAATAGRGNRIEGSRNEIWLCPGYDSAVQPVMLYVKLGLPVRAMLVEALAAQLAHALRLGAPPPYLVTVNPRHVGRPTGQAFLAFGSLDMCERSMARPVRALDVLLHLLDHLKVADLACVFDEWLANDVRSPSDILISPEGRIYLIDHEGAMHNDVQAGDAVTNWLAARLLERMEKADRAPLLRRLRARTAALMRVSLTAVPLAVSYSQDGVATYKTLVHFLQQRLQHLDRLLSQRVMPDQAYLTFEPHAAPAPLEDAAR